MYFVCAAGTSGTACSLQSWEPLSELRPHYVWAGVEEGWSVEENALVSGVKALAGNEEVVEEEEEEEDEEAAAGMDEPVSWAAEMAMAADADEEGAEEDEQEGEEEVEVRGWAKLNADDMAGVLPDGRELRPYQLDGLNWMRLNWYLKRNIILGDEMGLGKTAQTISLLQSLRQLEELEGPFLIVAPLSTLPHWERELALWTDMYVVTYHGPAEARQVILKHDWKLFEPRELNDGKKYRFRFHAVLTTFEMIVAQPEPLARVKWAHLIVDEGHRLKNRHSRVLDELREFRTRRKLVLTGTPLQNHVAELWAILNFLEPRKFGDRDGFLEAFGALSTGGGTVGQVKQLTKLLKPHLLRREKADVETLQPMHETLLHVEITTMQKICYRAVLEHNRGLLARGASISQGVMGAGAASASSSLAGSFANISMMLRHCCNHPWLIDEVKSGALEALEAESSVRPPRTERERSDPLHWYRQQQKMREEDEARYIDRMVKSSGKLVLLDKLLPKLAREGHRVLLFSQFTKLLDLIEDFVEHRGWGYERLDGTVTGATRQKAIDRFSDPASDSFLFLLSTRAGGVGINLTAADTVIMFDSDWNPQNDVQAMARCHRIGQQKAVQVYKLCTRDTYEMVMLQAANHKLGLEHAVIKQGGFEVSGGRQEKIDRSSTIERLLRAGAHVLTNSEHDHRIETFDQSSIEDILSRYGESRIVGADAPEGGGASSSDGGEPGTSSGGKSSTFALASFVSDESGATIDLDDPDFWSKMLPDVPQLDASAAAEMDAVAAQAGADRLKLAAKKAEPWPETGLDRALSRGRERKRERDEDLDEGGAAAGQAEEVEEAEWTHAEMEALEVVMLAVGHSRAPDVIAKGPIAEAPTDPPTETEVDVMSESEADAAAVDAAEGVAESVASEVKDLVRESLADDGLAQVMIDVVPEGTRQEAAVAEVDVPMTGVKVAEGTAAEDAPSVVDAGAAATPGDAAAASDEGDMGAITVRDTAKSEALVSALRSLAGRHDEPRGVKRACDAMLLGWLRHMPQATRAPLLPPTLHSIRPAVVRRAFLKRARGSARDPTRLRTQANVIALGFQPRPVGRAPSNDQGEQCVWAYRRGQWVEGMGDRQEAAAEAADLDRRLICLGTGLQPAAFIASATEEQLASILADDERAAVGVDADEAVDPGQAVAEGDERAISHLETRLNVGLIDPERFETLLEVGVASGHVQTRMQQERANCEVRGSEAAESAARAERARAHKQASQQTLGHCQACRGRHVRHTCGRGGHGK